MSHVQLRLKYSPIENPILNGAAEAGQLARRPSFSALETGGGKDVT